MQVTIRSDSVLLDGYVNAVERDSKVLSNRRDGQFIERIKAGAFSRALERAQATGREVKVLLNHDYGRELTTTRDPSTQLREDAIGLRCTCEIRDADVVAKAREKKLRGWSFGFIALATAQSEADGMNRREVRDMDLIEVSILDDTRTPAYNGTSVEAREEGAEYIEVRDGGEDAEYRDETPDEEAPVDLHEYQNRFNATRMA